MSDTQEDIARRVRAMTLSELFQQTDWTLLRQQKQMLLECCDQHPALEGLANWITDIQEIAAEQDYPVQWLSEDEEEGR